MESTVSDPMFCLDSIKVFVSCAVFRYYIEFLDECLEGHDNVLQEKLFTILASVEMVALARVMAIIHYKIAMSMR